jgi:predicted amidohydrolase
MKGLSWRVCFHADIVLPMNSASTDRSRVTRRQAIRTAGHALAGVAGLTALSPLPGGGLTAQAERTPASPPVSPGSPNEKLRVATCQFPVSPKPAENAKFIQDFMRQAAETGAHLLHTSEACLSGYPGTDLPSFENYDWDALRRETTGLRELAKDLKLWLVLGSAHFLDQQTKPTNCLYLINPEGQIADRYDKCFCTGGDQKHYSAGDRLVVRDLRGIRIGLAICYDICWPQLYIGYREKGATVMITPFTMREAKAKTAWIRSTSTKCQRVAPTIGCGLCATIRRSPIPTGVRSSPDPMRQFRSNCRSINRAC